MPVFLKNGSFEKRVNTLFKYWEYRDIFLTRLSRALLLLIVPSRGSPMSSNYAGGRWCGATPRCAEPNQRTPGLAACGPGSYEARMSSLGPRVRCGSATTRVSVPADPCGRARYVVTVIRQCVDMMGRRSRACTPHASRNSHIQQTLLASRWFRSSSIKIPHPYPFLAVLGCLSGEAVPPNGS